MGLTHAFTKRSPNYTTTYLKLFVVACLFSLFVTTTLFKVPGILGRFSSISPFGKCETVPAGCNLPSHNGNPSVFNTRWIVVTSISYPTQQVVKLSQIPGWQVLVVADKKTPKDWTFEGAILLDVETQSKLGYQVVKHIPWNSYARKIIGYLYAIQNGAEVIYDTDDDNAPDGDVTKFDGYFSVESRVETRGLVAQPELDSTRVKNPYVHFGHETIWPRGYPLDEIGRNYTPVYTSCRSRVSSIQQGVVNGDPDVDAIFRLTKKKVYAPLNIQFDSSAPPVIYPQGLFAPFNSQNTVFLYDAFWSLVLPVSVPFRVTDIWRGYWAQPLLWQTGNYLGFFAPHTTQVRNPHNYLKDLSEEVQLYQQAGELVNFLGNWTCQKDSDLYACMIQLTVDMVNQGFWGQGEIGLISAWVKDLECIGYRRPSITTKQASPCLLDAPSSPAIFHAKQDGGKLRRHEELLSFCNFSSATTVSTNPSQYPSTLLVVTFNFPHYQNIWLLDLLYRPHFSNILYCGVMKDSAEILTLGVEFSFIHANISRGYFAYECALRAIDMNYGVDNYLILSDDVLLNFWNLKDYDPKEMWTGRKESRKVFSVQRTDKGEIWWRSRMGASAFKGVMTELSSQIDDDTVSQFIKTRESHGLTNSTAWKGASDIFFLPKTKEDAFYKIGWIVRKHQMFLEFGVPFLLTGLSSSEAYVRMRVAYLWDVDWVKSWQLYNRPESTLDAIHPVKLTELGKSPKFKRDWCKNYVANALRH